MPILNLSTNVNLDGVVTSDILKEATSSVANVLGKPEAHVMILVKGSIPISYGGTDQPAAYGELVSIGSLNPDVNKNSLPLQFPWYLKRGCLFPGRDFF